MDRLPRYPVVKRDPLAFERLPALLAKEDFGNDG